MARNEAMEVIRKGRQTKLIILPENPGGTDEREDYLWIRILWSENPWVSIITSASSRTNTRILVKSINFRLKHQSRTVPGVPIIICLVTSVPLGTVEKRVLSVPVDTNSSAHCHRAQARVIWYSAWWWEKYSSISQVQTPRGMDAFRCCRILGWVPEF